MSLVYLIPLVIVLALLAYLFLLPAAIVGNYQRGLKYRERLVAQLVSLRLSGMLAALGIDVDQYLNGQRIVEVRRQMARCEHCAVTDRCDEQLDAGQASVGAIGFCANADVFRGLVSADSVQDAGELASTLQDELADGQVERQ